MASFDPAAATAAYLAQLSPAAHAKATAYTQGGHWLLLWGALVTFAACFLILKSRVLSRLEGAIEANKPRPWLTSLAVSALFLLVDWLIELPWSSYADWWREKAYGLNNQTWVGWFVENAITTLISVVVLSLFLMFLYALMRWAPRLWPVWAGVLTAAAMIFMLWLQPVFVEPLINDYKPAPPGPVFDYAVSLGKAVGVPTDKIYVYNGSKQSNRYTANVAGLFGTARVAMSDTMFAQGADLAEVRGVLGHEMGHYVRKHILISVVLDALGVMLLSVLARWLFPIVRTWLGAAEVGPISDPAGLPLLMAIFTALMLLATPLTNTLSRWYESDADAFSLRHAHEPDGLSEALVKTIEYRASSPSALEETIFYDHPSVQRRIRRAMDWKAAHLAAPVSPAAPAG